MHAIKDRKMVEIAKLGIMIWDSESAGTLSNVIDLVEQEKECYLWLASGSDLCRFDNLNSLEKFLTSYPEQTEEAKKRLNRFRKRELKSVQTEEQTLF
jgi:predicted flavoprotein YhiN